MAGDTHISDVEAGNPVEGVYAVVKKQRRHDKNGDIYLVLGLSDSTGSIEGRVWRNADWFDRNVIEGDYVRIIGKGSKYREQIQLDIRRIEKIEKDDAPAEARSFIPQGRRSIEDLAGELDFLCDEIKHIELASLVKSVWHGELREQLLSVPATVKDHHAYIGGLVEHTIAVAAICMTAAERHQHLNQDLLLSAALLHDIGRAREVRLEATVEAEENNMLVGHILLAHEMLIEAATNLKIDTSVTQWWALLIHAISQHHGPLERCRTHEAVVLASANSLDARLTQRIKS